MARFGKLSVNQLALNIPSLYYNYENKMKKETSRVVGEILSTDAKGGPVQIWEYDPDKLEKLAKALVSARKNGVMLKSDFSGGFPEQSGRQDLLPKILVIVPD